MGLVRRERELGRPYLGETASGAQLGQPQGRVCARDQDHVGIRGEVLEGVVQRREAFMVGDGLKIIEDDHEIFTEVGDPIHQLIDRRRDCARQPSQPPQSSTAQPLAHAIDGSCDVPPQTHRIVVSSVERHPGKRSRPTGAPRADRGCLSRTLRARRRASAPRRRPASRIRQTCRRSTIPRRCRGGDSFASASGSSSAERLRVARPSPASAARVVSSRFLRRQDSCQRQDPRLPALSAQRAPILRSRFARTSLRAISRAYSAGPSLPTGSR